MAESGALKVAGLRLVVEGASQFQAEIQANNQVIRLSQVEIEKLNASYGKNDTSAEKLAKKQAELNKQIEAQEKKIQTLRNARDAYAQKENASKTSLDKLTLAISKEELAQIQLQSQLKQTTDDMAAQEAAAAAAATAHAEAEQAAADQAAAQESAAEATEQATATMEDQRSALARLKDGLRQAAKDADAFGDKAIKAGDKWSKAGGKITRNVTLPIAAGLTFAAKEAIDFENAFADVEKTVNATDTQLASLRENILGLSKVLPQTKEEIAAVAALGGQFKVPVDNLDEYAKVMLNMGVATSMGATDAAEGMAQFAGIVQMNQGNYERLGSTIVALGNNMRTQEGPILDMGLRLAAAGKQAGMSEAKIMGISAALSSLGIEAEAGGSAMSKIILDMDMAAAKGGKRLAAFAKISGVSAKEFKAQWDKDAAGALTTFIAGLQRIEQSGGNVALTLEGLGYTEVRTRDALLRAVGAGDMFAGAINLANDAWAENNALAVEAAKKNGTFANRLKILSNNVGLTAEKFGDTLMPVLQDGMTFLSGLVDKFGDLNKGQRATLLTTVGLVAGFGPAVKGIGLLTQGVGYLGKAFGFLAGPHGWIALAVIGLAGLGIALASVKSQAQIMQDNLSGIKITVDEGSKQEITDAINTGMDAANKEHSITVGVNADTEELEKKLSGMFEDNKFTKKEFTAATKYVNDLVNPDIEAATKALDEKVKAFKATLDGAVNAQGQPLSEEDKTKLIDDVTAKTNGLIADLQAAQDDYNALLTQIYKEKRTPTEAELIKLQEYLDKIGLIRAELISARDEAIQQARANYNLTVSGSGNEQSTGSAIGYVQGTQTAAEQDAAKKRDDALAASQNIKNEQAALAASQAAWDAYYASVAAANQEAQAGYQAILDGVAKMAGADEKIATISQDYDTLKKVLETLSGLKFSTYLPDLGTWKLEDWQTPLKDLFGEKGLGKYLSEEDKIKVTDLLSAENPGEVEYAALKGIAEKYMSQLSAALAENASDPALNPLNTAIKSMLETGALSGIDPTTLDGAMEGLFKLYDAKARGSQLGNDIVAGVPVGIGEGAAALPADSFTALKDAVLTNLQTAFDSHSPARVVIPLGRNIPAGVAVGIEQNAGVVQTAAEKLPASASAGLAGLPGVGFSAGQGMMAKLLQSLVNGRPAVLAEAASIAAAIRQMLSDAWSYKPKNVTFDYSLGNGAAYTAAENEAKKGLISGAAAPVVTKQYIDNSPPLIIQNATFSKESDAWAIATQAEALRRRKFAGVGAIP